MRKNCILGVILALTLILPLSYAQATIILDFGTGDVGSGGTIKVLSGGYIEGTEIPVDVLTVTIDGVTTAYDTFGTATGANNDGNGSAALSFNTQTGKIEIVGGVAGLTGSSTYTLLSGTFSSLVPYISDSYVSISNARGLDTKNEVLLTALGIDPGITFEFFGFTFTADYNKELNSGSATSTDISNKVPEPATILLLGSGLVLAGIYRRRSRS